MPSKAPKEKHPTPSNAMAKTTKAPSISPAIERIADTLRSAQKIVIPPVEKSFGIAELLALGEEIESVIAAINESMQTDEVFDFLAWYATIDPEACAALESGIYSQRDSLLWWCVSFHEISSGLNSSTRFGIERAQNNFPVRLVGLRRTVDEMAEFATRISETQNCSAGKLPLDDRAMESARLGRVVSVVVSEICKGANGIQATTDEFRKNGYKQPPMGDRAYLVAYGVSVALQRFSNAHHAVQLYDTKELRAASTILHAIRSEVESVNTGMMIAVAEFFSQDTDGALEQIKKLGGIVGKHKEEINRVNGALCDLVKFRHAPKIVSSEIEVSKCGELAPLEKLSSAFRLVASKSIPEFGDGVLVNSIGKASVQPGLRLDGFVSKLRIREALESAMEERDVRRLLTQMELDTREIHAAIIKRCTGVIQSLIDWKTKYDQTVKSEIKSAVDSFGHGGAAWVPQGAGAIIYAQLPRGAHESIRALESIIEESGRVADYLDDVSGIMKQRQGGALLPPQDANPILANGSGVDFMHKRDLVDELVRIHPEASRSTLTARVVRSKGKGLDLYCGKDDVYTLASARAFISKQRLKPIRDKRPSGADCDKTTTENDDPDDGGYSERWFANKLQT